MNFLNEFANSSILARQVATEPNFIIRPIANLFGFIVNLVFNLVYSIGPINSLGITIIFVTIIFRIILLPNSLSVQRSMKRMQEIKPELDKIKEKYGNTKDPEKVKKMNAEQSALMSKHNANPLKSCLPMLLQMPLFIGFNFVLQQAFLYITRLREVYYDLAVAIMRVPDYLRIFVPYPPPDVNPNYILDWHRGLPSEHANAIRLLPDSIINNNIEAGRLYAQVGMTFEAARDYVGDIISLEVVSDFARVINRFTAENWVWLQSQIDPYYWAEIGRINEYRRGVESFLGLSMIEPGGFVWPGILVSILVGVTMFMAQWLGQQRMAGAHQDEKAKTQQRMMLIIMPVMFGFMTVTFPAGLGLFWIVTQLFQMGTDFVLMKRAGTPIPIPFFKKEQD